jgi:hypothetical protein
MTTHRIVLKISDEEIAWLGQAIESLDGLASNYDDDWEPDEEPLASLTVEVENLVTIKERIEREVRP